MLPPKHRTLYMHILLLLILLLTALPLSVGAQDSVDTPAVDTGTEQLPVDELPVEEEEQIHQLFLPLVSIVATPRETVIPDQYIVVFKEDMVSASSVSAIAAEMASQYGGEVLQAYDAALQGFAARFPSETGADVATQLQNDARVAYVEQDGIAYGDQEATPYGKDPFAQPEMTVDAASTEEVKVVDDTATIDTVQTAPVWGLDRNDQRYLPLNNIYIYFKTGAGVRAYIIDSGIRIAHSEFGGRALNGYDAVDGKLPADDCHGHGTHVAGTVGGKTYGVAKAVTLIAVRVLGCDNKGSYSNIIAGVNWVTNQKRLAPTVPMVANMSLGGLASSALDTAVYNSINAGVVYVVSAGNDNKPACNYSPARTAGTITVGATDTTDTRASFSNYGACVDIFAPGVSIKSAGRTSNTATATMSGTSMSAPHVTGVVALYLHGTPRATPATVRTTIFSVSTANIVKSPGTGSSNRLVYNPY